jgi:hypothetical protein
MKWEHDLNLPAAADGMERFKNGIQPFGNIGVVVAVNGGQQIVTRNESINWPGIDARLKTMVYNQVTMIGQQFCRFQ